MKIDIKETKKLIFEFFKDSNIKESNNIVTIKNPPKKFIEIFGKKAPYTLVFDVESHEKFKESELILEGSYFLSAIREYLKDFGQTTIIKIDVKGVKEFEEVNIKDKKSNKNKFIYFPQFTFSSNFEFLNHRIGEVNTITVKDQKVINFDLKNFKKLKVNKKDISELDVKSEYKIALKELDNFSKDEAKKISINLIQKLNNELERLNEHYKNQIRERDDELHNLKDRITSLKAELNHTYYDRDIDILNRKIRESEERLEKLKVNKYKERLEKEKNFHITDEVDKHLLKITHSLINVTIVCY